MTSERERHDGFSTGPSPFSDDFSATATIGDRHVEVIHGIYAHSLPLVGMSVGEARGELQERMRIDPESVAVVDGIEVDDNTVLREGQVLNFVRPAGEKG
jgi:hypothetical protein